MKQSGTDTIKIGSCTGAETGLFIVLKGSTTEHTGTETGTERERYKYLERHFVLSVLATDIEVETVPLVINVPITITLGSGHTRFYKLDFPRQNLHPKALVITTQAHPRYVYFHIYLTFY